ncbi:Early nodulin-like protein 1 [Apostasia shenzhenica]|uniref:Early nodulin-like protein 1 n=1 Tax=Apostasia shenzhenica TaxID=1088818 RepID=A0A2I0B6H8_9ASPA|nr:Early nodulin-like protein 1 [Apostasia shenzhenica]
MTSFVAILILLASSACAVQAQKQHKVGGADGWRTPPESSPDLYAVWASSIRFNVGDSIRKALFFPQLGFSTRFDSVFEYKNDSVVRVNKRGYYHCNESSGRGSAVTAKDGSTVFVFDRPGTYYFVSGELQHCKSGQRLMVVVMAPLKPPSPLAGAPGPSPALSAAAFSGDSAAVAAPALAVITAAFLLKYVD